MSKASTAEWVALAVACIAATPACIPDTISLLDGIGGTPTQNVGGGAPTEGGSTGFPSRGGAAGAAAGGGGIGPFGGAGGSGDDAGQAGREPSSPGTAGHNGGAPNEGPRCLPGDESMRCAPGTHCFDQTLTCVDGCFVDAHCWGIGVCDFVRYQCVQCVDWTDCLATLETAGMVCEAGACRECGERNRCPFDLSCNQGICNLDELDGPPRMGGPELQSDAGPDEPYKP